jgi:hypothetical protein
MSGTYPAALLAWVLLQATGFVVVLGGAFPFPWAGLGGWFTGVAAAEVALALLLWPAVAPAVPRGGRGAAAALGQGALLALLAVPFLLPSAKVSRAGTGDLVAALAGVAGWTALGTGIRAWGRSRRVVQAGAQGALLILAALPPWLAFLGEAHSGGELRGLARLSPVWGAAVGGMLAWIHAAASAALGASLAASAPEPAP